jgi:hypothetical protein
VLKIDLGNLHVVEDVRLLQCFILTVAHKTVPDDEWAFVYRLQSWFKLSSFGEVCMLSIFLLMHLRICAAFAFGVGGLLDSPGT